jgi:hypothetical protein
LRIVRSEHELPVSAELPRGATGLRRRCSRKARRNEAVTSSSCRYSVTKVDLESSKRSKEDDRKDSPPTRRLAGGVVACPLRRTRSRGAAAGAFLGADMTISSRLLEPRRGRRGARLHDRRRARGIEDATSVQVTDVLASNLDLDTATGWSDRRARIGSRVVPDVTDAGSAAASRRGCE